MKYLQYMISQLYPATSLVSLVKFPTFGAAPGDPPCQRLPAEPPEDSGNSGISH